ncbi:hypothetical protein ARMGADRAFT_1036560 [Armillaria gallica]|uniref:Uncharacterized protein n=1 Tax=Armillaria gallica TaxID=47427 RepID=A0A2H3DAH4_ARMGA|nr:hypothetical protein ARMGADRAFT_1036560 [Armillaria gallica]
MTKRCTACGNSYKTISEHVWCYHQHLYPIYISHTDSPEVNATLRTGLVPLTWAQVTWNALNGLICLENDYMFEYINHLFDTHPYIWTSLMENVLLISPSNVTLCSSGIDEYMNSILLPLGINAQYQDTNVEVAHLPNKRAVSSTGGRIDTGCMGVMNISFCVITIPLPTPSEAKTNTNSG